LRKIDGAKVQWKLEKLKSPGDMPSWADIQPFMPANWTNLKTCPDGGTYVLGRIGESPKCTFHRKYTVQ
jgi:hypothetical protein